MAASRLVLLVILVGLLLAAILHRQSAPEASLERVKPAIERHLHDTAAATQEIDSLKRLSGFYVRAAAYHRERRTRLVNDARKDSLGRPEAFERVVALDDSMFKLVDLRATALEEALDLSQVRAREADSLLVSVSRAISPRCIIARVVPCPSRGLTAALIAGAAVIALRR
jgi:hypothetical protein